MFEQAVTLLFRRLDAVRCANAVQRLLRGVERTADNVVDRSWGYQK
jgi:hypothetical protein